jgi:hypothetical protein
VSPAIALRAALEEWPSVPLSEGEQVLLKEWLDRIANTCRQGLTRTT